MFGKYNAPHFCRSLLFDKQLKFKMCLTLSHFYSLVLSIPIFLAYLPCLSFSSPFNKYDIGKSFFLEFMDQSDLLLFIMEHVNILKTVFQERNMSWREGKVVLLTFQNPHQRRYDVLRCGKYFLVDWEGRFNRKYKEGA